MHPSATRTVLLAGVLLLAFALTASNALAARDRKPPTAPGNLRAISIGKTSVTLAWNASTDNSGSFNYVVHLWQDPTVVTLPQTQTSSTWAGLIPNVRYFFWVEAVDAAGNKATSNLLSVTTLKDTSPSGAPTNLHVTGVTSSSVSLSWTPAPDDTGIREYHVFVNGSPYGVLSWAGPTSVDIQALSPSTTYSFAVRAQDLGYNLSPMSESVSATTLASTDTQPPTAPTNLYGQNWDCEVELTWTQSTDDQDPQSAIRYDVFINGQPDPLGGSVHGAGRTVTYGTVNGNNTFEITAVDSSGNVSAPSNPVTLFLSGC